MFSKDFRKNKVIVLFKGNINPQIAQITQIERKNLPSLRRLRIIFFKRLKGRKYPFQQSQPSAGYEAGNLSNKSLTISNPFEDIIQTVVKLNKE